MNLPKPVTHNARTGSVECGNCGVVNIIDPKKITNEFVYTDMHTNAPHYYPMQRCEQCRNNLTVVNHPNN